MLTAYPRACQVITDRRVSRLKLTEVLKGIEIIDNSCGLNTEISGIECDSRKIKDGFLFVAVRGFETDGNRFIDSAVNNGAAVVVTDDENTSCADRILVKDARAFLADASRNFFGNPAKDMKMIGVTGTNGKTTVTYLIKQCLEKNGAKCGLIGTNQNMIGETVLPTERTTPESNELWKLFSQMKESGCTHVIMEVSSHSLELSRVRGIEYDVGVFTNLTQDHLDFHKTMENYERAKAKLFSHSKIGVVNIDDPAGERISKSGKTKFITYSAKTNRADYIAENIKYRARGIGFELVGINTIGRIELGIPGRFSVYNALAASCALIALGMTVPEISGLMRGVKGVKGRAEVVPTDTDYTVMIDYAHSPDGMENILRAIDDVKTGRTIVVFGCGGDRDRTKRPKMGRIAASLADVVIVTSDNPRTEDPEAIISEIIPGVREIRNDFEAIADRKKAIFHALDIARAGDIVALLGKGHETYQEINHVKHHMDEREIVAEYFGG